MFFRRFQAATTSLLRVAKCQLRCNHAQSAGGVFLTAAALAASSFRRGRDLQPSCSTLPPSGIQRGTVRKPGLEEGQDFTVFARPRPRAAAAGTVVLQPCAAVHAGIEDVLAAICPEGDDCKNRAEGPGILLLGEVHDDVVAHGLQLHILQHCLKASRAQRRRLVLSLEMFERDTQVVLDEYILHQQIREQDLLQDARPWANYHRDYRPLIEFCKEHSVRVVAANAPRRYVSLVARHGILGLQSLLRSSRSPKAHWGEVPPLPFPPASAAYKEKFLETMASQMPPPSKEQAESGECPFIGFRAQDVREAKQEMLEAQLLWDHTMAMSIAEASRQQEGEVQPPLVLHICGAFHCSHGLGIPEVLPRYLGINHSNMNTTPIVGAPWLPIDEVGDQGVGIGACDDSNIGPKTSPQGVMSIICWPAAVEPTLDLVKSGNVPQSIGLMGDWVIITEETFDADAPATVHGGMGS